MKTLTQVAEMQVAAAGVRGSGRRVGFVPTMGALHAGHLSLVRAARQRSDVVVVSIFVNPAQFGPGEDYRAYPRDLEGDAARLLREGVDFLFAPPPEEIYPTGFQTFVEVEKLSRPLCGQSRGGHFRGVATVVTKLFNIVQPDLAFFGRKDAQQSILIRQMVRDLNLPVEIIVCPIVREPDGLAMSSRNAYLSREERRAALVLHRSLSRARERLEAGAHSGKEVVATMRAELAAEPLARADYMEVVDAETLEPVERLEGTILVALAVWIGKARLIDNLMAEQQPDGRWRVDL
jgi:pantoate--beta-alanine ligase